MDSRRWSNTTKIIVVSTLAVLAIVLLVTFRAMIAPTIVAFLFAFVLGYPVNWIQQRTGWGRGATVAVLYLVILAATIIVSAIFIPRSADLITSTQGAVSDLVSALKSLFSGPDIVIGAYTLSFGDVIQQGGDVLQRFVVSSGNPFTLFRGFTTGVLTVLYVLVLSFWVLKDMHKLQRALIERLPGDYQEEFRHLGQDIGEIWHAFLRGQLVLAITITMLTWIALSILGMPNAGGLAVLAGFMEFLPTVGPGISMAVGAIIALVSGSNYAFFSNNFTFAIIVLLTYNAITWVESAYLIPRLVGSRVRLHPAITFVAIISSAVTFGLIGVLLATPVVASARDILIYIYRKLQDQEPFEQSIATQPVVRIRGLIAGRKIEGIIFELDGVLTQLDWSFAEQFVQRTQWLERIFSAEGRYRFAQRFMITSEGMVNFFINRLEQWNRRPFLNRMQPYFDRLRGHPPRQELTLIPGTTEALRVLGYGYKLALTTTRKREGVQPLLANGELDEHIFDVILTRENVRRISPHSEAFLTAADLMDLEPSNLLVISDTDANLRSAAAVNMATAGVLSGLSLAKDFQSADLILDSVADLTEWL
jgi:predicted PurR-regulated permease PerM/phosphoglycolate phosphatase-like HAD superfamily hydrolase